MDASQMAVVTDPAQIEALFAQDEDAAGEPALRAGPAEWAEPLHLGACLADGKLHAIVMRREPNGHITVVATAEIAESMLREQDCHAVMAPASQAPAPAPDLTEAQRHTVACMDSWATCQGLPTYSALMVAQAPAVGAEQPWQAMLYAPRDGSKIELLVEHREYWIALKAGRADGYRQACEGHWVDFNGGGWSWMGTAGQPIGWRPLRTGPVSDVPEQGSQA